MSPTVLALALLLNGTPLPPAQLPRPVQAALAQRYPGAQVLRAEREKGDTFEVELKQGDAQREVSFDANGATLGEEAVIARGAAPAPVQLAIATLEKAGHKLNRLERITTTGKPSPTFEAMLERKGALSEVTLDAAGKTLRVENDASPD